LDSELEQEQWSKDGQVERLGGLAQVEGKDAEQRPFEVDEKDIFSNRSKQAKPKAGEKTDKKGGKGQSVHWKVWWRQGHIKCAVSKEYSSCWVHQDCHVADEQKSSFAESGRSIRRKRRMSSAIEQERTRLLDGHGDRHAQRLQISEPSNDR